MEKTNEPKGGVTQRPPKNQNTLSGKVESSVTGANKMRPTTAGGGTNTGKGK